MALSLGLTLYNLGQRREPEVEVARAPRPAGRLVWLHAATVQTVSGLLELARHLAEEDGLPILLTCTDPLAPRNDVIVQMPPPDTPADARAFLDHWRPEIAVFSGGEIRPMLLHEAAERKLPLLMVDARAPFLLRNRDGWFPGLFRSSLSAFAHISAVDESAARAFRKAGAALTDVAVTGRLEEESAVLPCLEAERAALAQLFLTRPVWFAAALPAAEDEAVIAAHRAGLRLAHRLLLIVLPDHPDRAPALAARCAAEGWISAQRSLEEEPDPETEVYIVDNPEEIGLWYRLAPVSFLGGSLSGTGALRNPAEAAALGSAILHGPRAGQHGSILGRLGAARAARAVSSPQDLGEALGDLLAPDRTARLAQAAWAVVSEGAEVTEALLIRMRRLMDGEG